MMTSASSSAGDRVLERMQACLAAKEYYAALQLTRSYWNRCVLGCLLVACANCGHYCVGARFLQKEGLRVR